MEERNNELDKIDDVMLPGFRFHPTDEELVDFYLKRKIQHKTLPIELIKQVDIYKYDPWDLPKLASTGEKEWYFYCPRDRKYRNSVRPNRVTRAGFWKATGTDRPIYSSEGKCIGLKKSLVFYRGRAAKGMKTDWMMHEFRLPCISDSGPPKKFSDKTIPPSDSWAICRIFKKTTSISMAQKALCQPWFSQLPATMVSDILTQGSANFNNNSNNNHQFSSENIHNNISSCTIPIAASSTIINQVSNANTNFSASSEIIPSYNKPIINSNNSIITTTVSNKSSSSSSQIPTVSNAVVLDLVPDDNNSSFNNIFYTLDSTTGHTNPLDCIGFEDPNQQHYNINTTGFSITLPQDNMQMQATTNVGGLFVEEQGWRKNLNSVQLSGFPFNLSPNNDDYLKPTTFPWELSHPA